MVAVIAVKVWLLLQDQLSSSGLQKRNYLSVEKKVEVIKHSQKNPGTSVRALGEIFGCGKTQIGHILKNKESLLSLYQANTSGSRVHTSKSRTSVYVEVNDALYKWFTLACSRMFILEGRN